MHTQTATEYWQRRGSLVHTDTKGNDLAQPDGVRVYLWASSQHFANPLLGAPRKPAAGINYVNPVHTSPIFRGTAGRDGPLGDRRHAAAGLARAVAEGRHAGALPAVCRDLSEDPRPAACRMGRTACRIIDFGPEADAGLITKLPPEIQDAKGYAVLLPAADADGNDIPASARRWCRRRSAPTPPGTCAPRARAAAIR